MAILTIPHNYIPRDYQLPLLRAIDNGIKRAVVIWHRRAGKDKTLLNVVVKRAMKRVGTYYYFFPTYAQGKKILWNGIDGNGFKFLNHIPESIRKRTDNGEMLIELKNGSIIQIIGTDKIDSIVGTNPIGCVFSEYALQNPAAWAFIRPILRENGGWAIFNYTPRGDNHGHTLYKSAKTRDNWFVQLLKATDTGVFTEEGLAEELQELIDEHGEEEGRALFDQEYMCSFTAPVIGSYYGSFLQKAEEEKRIGFVPHEPALPVYTHWDLGVGDSMAIWFEQRHGKEVRLIDYYENSNFGLDHYAKKLQEKPYVYGKHFAPHDIKVREMGSGKSRLEVARALGIEFTITPKLSIEDGIQAARNILPRCWFNEKTTEAGIQALKNYKKDWDDVNKVWKNYPKHDWTSHASDAFRYLAINVKEEVKQEEFPEDDLLSWLK